MKILHITAHLGGGIGTVLSGVCIRDAANTHTILCLEPTKDNRALQKCADSGIEVILQKQIDVDIYLGSFDVVQIEWWHHPLMSKFMVEHLGQIPVRLVIWSHISGCNFPWIPSSFVELADAFIFATPYSFDNPGWTSEERQRIKEKAHLVISSGNDFSAAPPEHVGHDGFQVGYVGFLGYEKTSPDFVKICESCADIPGIHFPIVGDLNYADELKRDVEASPFRELFKFRGYAENVWEQLAKFDLFACLLQKEHTGASENALLEAMYAGVCPVVFRQCTEQYLVQDGVTGIVCEGVEEFRDAVHELYHDREKRDKLGRNASDYVRTHLSIQNTVKGLQEVYTSVMTRGKRLHDAVKVFGDLPDKWFLTCYQGDVNRFRGLAAGKSKGSIHQYYRYFPCKALEDFVKRSMADGSNNKAKL